MKKLLLFSCMVMFGVLSVFTEKIFMPQQQSEGLMLQNIEALANSEYGGQDYCFGEGSVACRDGYYEYIINIHNIETVK